MKPSLAIALLASAITRLTPLREDASLATLYLVSLALGVILISARGSAVDVMHLLFGSVLAIDDTALIFIGIVASITVIAFAVLWRPLVLECVDPGFLRSVSRSGGFVHLTFLALVVLNLVTGFHALGTLLAVGMMMLPPVMVSLPFKLIFFVLVDGWRLVSASLVQGFVGL